MIFLPSPPAACLPLLRFLIARGEERTPIPHDLQHGQALRLAREAGLIAWRGRQWVATEAGERWAEMRGEGVGA